MRRVSPDYTATGELENARAYVYGNVTLLEFESSPPLSVIIRDETGEMVAYERIGWYYRLDRIVDNFTVWAYGQSVTFSATMTTRIFSTPKTANVGAPEDLIQSVGQVDAIESEKPAVSPDNEALIALLRLSKNQLAQARRLFDEASKNPKVTGQELFDVSQHLKKIGDNLLTAATATVRVNFPTGSTVFRPEDEISTVLIASGRTAEKINIRGRTDARVAGPADPGIALGRAMMARKFLIDHGINPQKIRIFSKADKGFSAPNVTQEGRAMNRRVDIEIIDSRIKLSTVRYLDSAPALLTE